MWTDDVVVLSLIILAVTCIIMGYFGVFAYRHIKEDTENANKNDSSKKSPS